jgi:hypothetical protein
MINNKVFREFLKIFKVHLFVDWFFRFFPREGIFYDGVFDLSQVETFADLGCNRGFFSVWLAEKSRCKIKGILVEANPALIPEVDRLLKKMGSIV